MTYRSADKNWKIIKRSGDVCLAEAGQYEVFIMQQSSEREIDGRVIHANEHPPCDNQWGKKGWTFRVYESALKKFEELDGK